MFAHLNVELSRNGWRTQCQSIDHGGRDVLVRLHKHRRCFRNEVCSRDSYWKGYLSDLAIDYALLSSDSLLWRSLSAMRVKDDNVTLHNDQAVHHYSRPDQPNLAPRGRERHES